MTTNVVSTSMESPQFSNLPRELIRLVAASLDRKSAAALMRSNQALYLSVKEFVWFEVPGIDVIFALLPFVKRARSEGGFENDTDDWLEEDDAVVIGGSEEYHYPTAVPPQCIKRLKEYTQHVRVLNVHSSPQKASFHGLTPLLAHPYAPLFPKLERLVVSPRGTLTISVDKEFELLLGLCGSDNLRAISISEGTGDLHTSLSFHEGRAILSFLASRDLRLKNLDISLSVHPLPLFNLPVHEEMVRSLDSLTTVTLQGRALSFVPLRILSALPHLTCINLYRLEALEDTSLSLSPGTRLFPSLTRLELGASMCGPIAKLLGTVIPTRLHIAVINTLHLWLDRDDVTPMLESLESQRDTLRVLQLSFGPTPTFTMIEREIITLSTLSHLTHFECNSLAIGDQEGLLELIQSWPSVEALVMPYQHMEVTKLEALARRCPRLSLLVIQLTRLPLLLQDGFQSTAQAGSHSSLRDTSLVSRALSPISTGSVTIKCLIIGAFDRTYGSLLARYLAHCWQRVILVPLNESDPGRDTLNWVAGELECHGN